MLSLTLYLICPDDVRHGERAAAGEVIERLQARYWRSLRLEVIPPVAPVAVTTAEAFAPERPPLRPDECDLVIAALADGLAPYVPSPDGDKASSRDGTEREITRAIAGDRPEIRLYRRQKAGAEVKDFWQRVIEPIAAGERIRHETYAETADFAARFEAQLEEILRARLQKSRHPEALAPRPVEGCPYKGEMPFRFEDAGLYFGRDRLIAEGLRKLQANRDSGRAFLLVHGETGSGRTSLVQAGLAPRLTADGFLPGSGAWRRAELAQATPEALASALIEALPELEKMKDPWTRERLMQAFARPQELALTQAALIAALDLVSVARPAQLLLLIEDLQMALPLREREILFRALALLAKSRRIWIVATAISSAVPKLTAAREIADLIGPHGQLLLRAPSEDELNRMVRYPALAAEIQYENRGGEDLAARIVEDATGEGHVLGALEYSLRELYRQRRGRLLTWSAYEALGGVRRIARDGIPAETTTTAVDTAAKSHSSGKLRFFQFATVTLAITAGVLIFRHREPSGSTPDETVAGTTEGPLRAAGPAEKQLAEADFATGAELIEAGSPDEGLPFLLSALRNDPANTDAQILLLNTYCTTLWHAPALQMQFPEPVRRLSFGAEGSTLYTALDGGSDGFQTVLNWNVKNPAISGILKPEWNQATGQLLVSPDGRHVVIERASAGGPGTSLLCDAKTLQIQSVLTPSKKGGCYCWSSNGSLLSYVIDADRGEGTQWRMCDMATGATVRETEIFPNVEWIASSMTNAEVKAISKNGELFNIPLNPRQPVSRAPLDGSVRSAVFSTDSLEFLVNFDDGNRRTFTPAGFDENAWLPLFKSQEGAPKWLRTPDYLSFHPWSRDEARSLADTSPVTTDGKSYRLNVYPRGAADPRAGAPFHADAEVTAIASLGSRVAIATADGKVTIHNWIPNSVGSVPRQEAAREEPPSGRWEAIATTAKGGRLEQMGNSLRILQADGQTIELPGAYDQVAVAPDNERALISSPSGLQEISLADGSVLASDEDLGGAASIVWLGGGEKAALAGTTQITIISVAKDPAAGVSEEQAPFEEVASLPVKGALSLKALADGSLAVATPQGIELFESGPFTRRFTLPLNAGYIASGFQAWAEDSEHGWLAYCSNHQMQVWSTRSGRVLAKQLKVESTRPRLEFGTLKERVGVKFDGGGFVALGKAAALNREELAAMDSLIVAACGTRLDSASRRIVFADPAARREASQGNPDEIFGRLLPEMSNIRFDLIAAASTAEMNPTTWNPLWERLAFLPGSDPARILKWAQSAKDPKWLHLYQCALTGEGDRVFYGGRGIFNENIAQLLKLAGLKPEEETLRRAAWTLRSAPEDSEEAAAARKPLDERVARTKADYDGSVKTFSRALAYAEALSLRGKQEDAAAFLEGKVPGDADLTLEQAHFLISSGLAKLALPALDRALATWHSPWLWCAWLDFQRQDRSGLPPRVQEAMMNAGGRGPVAAKALAVALDSHSLEAIAMALRQAKGLPKPLGEYLTAQILWLQDRKAEVYSLWPDERPDLRRLAETGDWGEWEVALNWREVTRFFGEIENELETLRTHPGDTLDVQRRLASKLMDPKTAATFGGKRTRDAALELALVMSYQKEAAPLVQQMIEQARLAGADPVKCLRAEARSLFATGQPTTAYSRWIQILDDPEHGMLGSDCVEAAQCLVQDQQVEAAVELLMRNGDRFAKDANYAYQAGWVLLGIARPEQAEVLLDRGFAIPYPQDQIQMATAMKVCAAELMQQTDRANASFLQLVQYDAAWGKEANLKQLQWPQQLKLAMIAVAARNR